MEPIGFKEPAAVRMSFGLEGHAPSESLITC